MSTPPDDERQQAIQTTRDALLAIPGTSEAEATDLAEALVDEAIRRGGAA